VHDYRDIMYQIAALTRYCMRSALFWDVTQRRVVIPYGRFGTTYRSHRQGSRNPRRDDTVLLDVFHTVSCVTCKSTEQSTPS
jgi:hypothetical protein